MRDLVTVIDSMLNHIPRINRNLVHALESCQQSARYSSPESIGMWWRTTGIVLSNHFGEENNLTDWQQTVVDIFMDKVEK